MTTDDRLIEILDNHFDPRWGSRYWLDRQRELGVDARSEIRSLEDLDRLGPMDSAAFFENSVWDFVPQKFHACASEIIVVETGGTMGKPRRTAYLEDDFHDAFVAPFLAVAADFGFQRGARWAWIGPGGPHAVGKAARAVCRAMGSPDPFEVDFDPRWFKAQSPNSLGRSRYLEHVLEQAVTLIENEPIEVLFSTPPVLLELGKRLSQRVRSRIEAVHLGGLAVDEESAKELFETFAESTFLSGYGNSLFGMCPQVAVDIAHPVYYPHGDRLHFRLVATESGTTGPRQVDYGEWGRLLATRLDPSFLIVNLLERDRAIRCPSPSRQNCVGFLADGLGSPRPVESLSTSRLGIY